MAWRPKRSRWRGDPRGLCYTGRGGVCPNNSVLAGRDGVVPQAVSTFRATIKSCERSSVCIIYSGVEHIIPRDLTCTNGFFLAVVGDVVLSTTNARTPTCTPQDHHTTTHHNTPPAALSNRQQLLAKYNDGQFLGYGIFAGVGRVVHCQFSLFLCLLDCPSSTSTSQQQ